MELNRVVLKTALTVALAASARPAPAAPPPGVQETARPAFEEVVRGLSSADPRTRVDAMRALADAGYPEAMAPLAALLTDPQNGIQREAIDTLIGFVVTEKPRELKRTAGILLSRQDPARATFEAGPFVLLPRVVPAAVVTGLAAAGRDDDVKVRRSAIYALGILARPPLDPGAALALASALADEKAEVRVASANVLGALRVESAGDALIEAMNDKAAEVRRAAMRALGDIRETRALRALSEHLSFYRKGAMAEAALDGLARVGHASSQALFEQYASDKDAALRRRAYEGLARVGQADALARHEGTLASEGSKAAALALAFALQRGGRPGLDRLVAGLGDRALEAQAMSYLVELGPSVAAPLGVRLQDPDPVIRERLAMVLGMLGGPDALAALERAAQDADISVQRAAERGIARIRLGQ